MKIDKKLKEEVIKKISDLNKILFKNQKECYKPRFSGSFIYLDYFNGVNTERRCRLKYDGDMNDLSFAIFKWSSETYDDEDWFFPGSEEVNGTIEGSMRAGILAYS